MIDVSSPLVGLGFGRQAGPSPPPPYREQVGTSKRACDGFGYSSLCGVERGGYSPPLSLEKDIEIFKGIMVCIPIFFLEVRKI